MSEEHPIKQLYNKEQTERAAEWRTDYCVEEAMGAMCLHHALEPVAHETVIEREAFLDAA